MKLELGAGLRPSRGYTHHDRWWFPHIEICDDPWMIDFPDDSVDEILAVAFIEHLSYHQALDTFRNVHRMLRPGGEFIFDVPDYPTWVGYYLSALAGESTPFTFDDIQATLHGWGRWPGDEHKWGWDADHLAVALNQAGFVKKRVDLDAFVDRTDRARFTDPLNAHIYMVATK